MPIRRIGDKFKIENVRGFSPTLEAARKRLRAVKARQNAEGKSKGHHAKPG